MLTYGMSNKGIETFCKKHNITHTSNIEEGTSLLSTLNKHSFLTISPIPGDCTAASINTHELPQSYLEPIFKLLPEFLSLNARISAFFSLNRKKADIKTTLEFLKQFQIVGLHIQHNNRLPTINTYQITGLLKVPAAYINSYNRYNGEDIKHDHTNCEEFNKLNKEFNLQTL